MTDRPTDLLSSPTVTIETPNSAPQPQLKEIGALTLLLTSMGNPKSALKIAKAAVGSLGILARRDEFRDQIVLSGEGLPTIYHGIVTENALVWIRNQILECRGFDPSEDKLHSAVKAIAEVNRFNPVTEYLSAQPWDGRRRLKSWLSRVTGAEQSELNSQLGALLIVGMVVRAFHPGTKFDLCIVLEGPQGSGKSTLVRALSGGEYFTDAPGLLALDGKSRGELFRGRWIVELQELSGLNRTEVEMVKAAISQTDDHFRAPYDRVAVSRPRTFVFVGTTNSQQYLMDTTGNRRFVPVKCGIKIDIATFLAERDQLFAEAVHFIEARAASWGIPHGKPLPPEKAPRLPYTLWQAAALAAEERRIVDHGEEVLESVLKTLSCKRLPNGAIFVGSLEIQDALYVRLGHRPHPRMVTNWMAKLGWTAARHGSGPGGQMRGFQRTETPTIRQPSVNP